MAVSDDYPQCDLLLDTTEMNKNNEKEEFCYMYLNKN